jgi:hypothetical protein
MHILVVHTYSILCQNDGCTDVHNIRNSKKQKEARNKSLPPPAAHELPIDLHFLSLGVLCKTVTEMDHTCHRSKNLHNSAH